MEKNAIKRKSKVWPWLTGVGLFLASKLKWVFGLLKIGKFATLASMMVSLGAYAVFYGWKFAVAIVYLIFVHEMGHLWAAKRKNLKTTPAIFIPFLGAAVGMKELPKNAKDEAFVAYAGPLFGLLSFLPAVVLYETDGSPFWGLVIFLGALINLFNLFPVSPLDGGRIVGVLSTKIWSIGLTIMIPYFFFSPDPILFLIFLFGIGTWWKRVREDFSRKELDQVISLTEKEASDVQQVQLEIDTYKDMTNFPYILNTFLEDVRTRKARLIRNIPGGSFFPFVHDKKKLEKRAILTEIALLEERESRYLLPFKQQVDQAADYKEAIEEGAVEINAPEPPYDYAEQYLAMLHQNRNKLQAEAERMKNYYQSTRKTKMVVLLLYLLLAGVLSGFVVYGNSIMELHRNMLP
ncbi:site-2 protease family protein [Fictibacillus iocasae]|uniref:Site-2 protease family protein n=1 Tax=Fictibacillus iocasae TaxID=2715437 RepID=A0ABW2NTN5_9BACL